MMKLCSHPGCRVIVSGARCDRHEKQRATGRYQVRKAGERPGYFAMYGRKWREARLVHLAEHPLCLECLTAALIVPATEVDHIVPHKGDMATFWDRKNLQSLCIACHSAKTAKENA
jgi:5-methylcytosine-specific restriction protein A